MHVLCVSQGSVLVLLCSSVIFLSWQVMNTRLGEEGSEIAASECRSNAWVILKERSEEFSIQKLKGEQSRNCRGQRGWVKENWAGETDRKSIKKWLNV